MANSTPSAPLQAAVEDLVRILQQPSPPSLRELLEAYSVKGNGDRELLLAMLSAKSSEDQRVAAVIQSHQTLIQAHAAAQTQMQQQQLLVQYQQQGRAGAGAGPGPSQETARGTQQQQTETETPRQMQRQMQLQAPGHQVTGSGSGSGGPVMTGPGVIAQPSPSGTSQSQSSSSSPRLVTTLPPLHTHLADVRTMGGGPQTKRRRTERDVMMLESIGSRGASLGSTCRLDSGRERRERHSSSQLQSQPQPSSSPHTQSQGGRERSRDKGEAEERTAARMAVDTDEHGSLVTGR